MPEANEKEFLLTVSKIYSGSSLGEYMREAWFEGLRSNPCGGSFISIKDGEIKKVDQISIFNIKSIGKYSNTANYILFEPEISTELTKDEFQKEIEVEVKVYLFITNDDILIIKEKDENIVIIEKKKNELGFIPFAFNSINSGTPNIKESSDRDISININISPLNDELQLLDAYLRKNSVKELHEFLHAYPIYWRYVQQCDECKGFGEVNGTTCGTCGGSGILVKQKDVTNVVDVPIPEEGESNITPPAGYVTPPIEIIEAMRTELKDKFSECEFSHWGTLNILKQGDATGDQTATESLINLQPVVNRLNLYTEQVQTHHNILLNFIVKIMFSGQRDDIKVFYAYGRGYVIETADTAMKRYLNDKKENAPQEVLNNDLVNYYASQFKSDNVSYERAIKLMRVEPFVHNSTEEVVDKFTVAELDKKAKSYYNEWRSSITDTDIDKSEPKQLTEQLYTFVKSKEVKQDGTN
jgi:hypothetical protein